MGKPHQFQEGQGLFPGHRRPGTGTAEAQGGGHIFPRSHLHKRLGDLKGTGNPGPAAAVGRPGGDILALKEHFSDCGSHLADDEVHEGGFAGAVGTDQGDPGASRHPEADARQRPHASVEHLEALHLEHQAASSPR